MEKIDPQRYPLLKGMSQDLMIPDKFLAALKRCIGPSGEIRDESSPDLYAVRKEIRGIREMCAKKVNESLTHSNISHYLQDEYLTISSDRYVLALKANFKGKLEGIIHDYSQTGETCYFEPLFLMDLNNSLQRLRHREKDELHKVLTYLTGLCRESLDLIRNSFEWLISMDYILAKAKFAQRLKAGPLHVSSSGRLHLKNIRHPLLALGGFQVVPMDIKLEPGQHVLVVSGGNAGGKTVCLKTLGLAALMALCALPVPADEGSSIPFWDKIFVSMVSEQSVEESLSTFTAQLHHFTRFWQSTDENTLVILDEFGVGTDPSQGAALAQAVVDGLMQRGTWVATATHFPALKAYSLSRPEVRAASVLFDDRTGRPMYQLAYDQVGSSLALSVAREQGFPAEIIAGAEKYLLVEGRDQEQLFERLNHLAAQREKELKRLEKKEALLDEKYQKRQMELVNEKNRLFSEIRKTSQEIVRKWQEQKIGRKKALKDLAQLRKQLGSSLEDGSRSVEANDGLTWEDISAGALLVYKPWNRKGLILEKDDKKKQIKIDMGGISIWVDPKTLEEAGTRNSISSSKTSFERSGPSVSMKLDLRGNFADEALARLEQYIDQAVLAGQKRLEIVHGKGTGALRAAVHKYLESNSAVAGFSSASEESGGWGMTEVELR